MDQQRSQVFVPALGDSAKSHLATGRVLSGHQTQPCGKVSPTFELSGVRRTGQQGCCGLWSDTRYGHKALGLLIAPGHRFDLPIVSQDFFIELSNALVDVVD